MQYRATRLTIAIDYLFITLGAAIMAVGVGVFLVDARVVPGGVSGLAMAIHYVSGSTIPVGVAMWAMNIPLFIWGVKELGGVFGWRTFYGFTTSSLFIDLVRGDLPVVGGLGLQHMEAVTYLREHDFLLLVLVGAALLGLGLGVIFKFKGTTAGSDVIAAIMQKRFGVKPGTTFITTDMLVILVATVVLQVGGLTADKPALVLAMYALILVILSSKLVDLVIDGFGYARSVFIISDRHAAIASVIMHEFKRGATAFHGRGLYRGVERDILYTVVNRRELHHLVDVVRRVDPKAFVTVSDVHEVLGEGFRSRSDLPLPSFIERKLAS